MTENRSRGQQIHSVDIPTPEYDAPEDTIRYEESLLYEEKIRRLEETIGTLRMSRRILVDLLDQVQTTNQQEYQRLCRENSRLRQQVHAYAVQIWQAHKEGLQE